MAWPKILGRGLLTGIVILTTGGLGLLVVRVGYLPTRDQTTAIQFWSFALTALGSVITIVSLAAKALIPTPPPQPDELLRLLAKASRDQWQQAATERQLLDPAPLPIRWRHSTAQVAGPDEAATTYARFDPLPGLTAVDRSGLQEGNKDALHRIYGGLPSGRLLLIGPPGSGKSTAAILLLLDALRHRERTREDQESIPVPVLFTLHGWDPAGGESVIDWMVGKLAETYLMFGGHAGRRVARHLLTEGRLAAFLDGLDEIPLSLRPSVLTALADAPFRLVLVTRTEEAVNTASHGRPLAGAIALELQPVKPADAAAYLLAPLLKPPQAPWEVITDHLTEVGKNRAQASVVSEALTTPLALSLLRDTYDPTGRVDELLDTTRFPTAASIKDHLLDRAVEQAYKPRHGRPSPRYSVETAQRTLRYLATQLTAHGTRDLAWWHIPTWRTHRSRRINAAVMNVLVNGLVFGFGIGLSAGFAIGLSAGLGIGLSAGLVSALTSGRWQGIPIMPTRITRPSYRSAVPRPAISGLLLGLLSGLLGGLLTGFSAALVFGLAAGLVFGFAGGLASGLAGVALSGLARQTEVDKSSLWPADVWRQDRNAGLVYLLVSGLVVSLLGVLTVQLVPGFISGLASRLSVVVVLLVVVLIVLVWGLIYTSIVKSVGSATTANPPGCAAVDTTWTSVQLAIQHKIPLRLIAFLEDARSRHLLRAVGAVYQFRHAALQDRLAQTPTKAHPSSEVTR